MIIEGIYARYGTIRLCGCELRKSRAARDTKVKRYADAKAPRVAGAISRVLERWGKRVATAVGAEYRRLGKAEEDDGSEVERLLAALNAESMGEEIESAISQAMRDAFRRAAAVGIQEVGFSAGPEIVNHMDEAARDYAETRGSTLIKDLAGTTRDDMRSLLARAIEEGMSVDMLESAIADLGAFGASRATTIARTELAFAHVQGNMTGWRATGEVSGKRVMLGDNHDIEDICDEAVAVGIIGIDEEFVDGYEAPPFHPRCVCDVEPILRQVEEPEE